MRDNFRECKIGHLEQKETQVSAAILGFIFLILLSTSATIIY